MNACLLCFCYYDTYIKYIIISGPRDIHRRVTVENIAFNEFDMNLYELYDVYNICVLLLQCDIFYKNCYYYRFVLL